MNIKKGFINILMIRRSSEKISDAILHVINLKKNEKEG